jgi:hypothetical protein
MTDLARAPLEAWQSYYVIIGSSAAALIAIQFVVFTLVDTMRVRASEDSISAFGSSTVVHLTSALIASAIISAPWSSLAAPSGVLALGGLTGLVYSFLVVLRQQRQTLYKPVWEDWLWYTLLPCGVYAVLAAAALVLGSHTEGALFGMAAATLGMLLIGIHNAWDTVTHIVITNLKAKERHRMDIKRSGAQASTKGPDDYFTGIVRIDPLVQSADPARGSVRA